MIGVLLLSHGQLSKGIVHSAKMIAGVYDNAARLSLMPGVSSDIFVEEVKTKIEKLDKGDGVLVLTDMKGGTPFLSACRMLQGYNVAVVTGMNLPMVIEALMSNGDYTDLKEFADFVVESGKENNCSVFEIG